MDDDEKTVYATLKGENSVFKMQDKILRIGRGSNNDIVLKSNCISGSHLVISLQV